MKKFLYIFVFMFAAFSASADSYMTNGLARYRNPLEKQSNTYHTFQ